MSSAPWVAVNPNVDKLKFSSWKSKLDLSCISCTLNSKLAEIKRFFCVLFVRINWDPPVQANNSLGTFPQKFTNSSGKLLLTVQKKSWDGSSYLEEAVQGGLVGQVKE